MIRYYRLFDLLNRRGMKKTDLLKVISSPTLAKISKGENITTEVIDKICLYLNCQPSDIMEVIVSETEQTIDNEFRKTVGLPEIKKQTVIVKPKLPNGESPEDTIYPDEIGDKRDDYSVKIIEEK